MDPNSKQLQTVKEAELQPYELFILLMCGYSLFALALQTFLTLRPDDIAILDAFDNLVCGIFLIDFLIRLIQAPQKWNFFVTWGWIDLISSIPAIDIFRAGRIVRVIRILRILRGIRVARILAKYLRNHRADGAILAVVFVSLLLLVLSSVAILQVEQPSEESNIKTPSDALWWALTTMTTVGYGDKFPVTTIGRIIASFLMIGGVGLFGTLSGSVTSWILNPTEERQEVDLDQIQNELKAIHLELEKITSPSPIVTDPQLIKLMQAWPGLSPAARSDVERLLDLKPNP
jgi:voltage-gated potassium channel